MDRASVRSLGPTAWDVRAGSATLALGALLFALACLLTGATDEGSVSWATRAARTLPVAPLCGAVVTWLALARARRRGELLALESIGCSPARAAAYVVVAAAALGAIAAASVVVFPAAQGAFFPRASARDDVVAAGDGFFDAARGVRIDRAGELTRQVPARVDGAPEAPRVATRGRAASAAVVLALLAIALPLVAARAARGRDGKALAFGASICVLCILLMQAAAAGRASPALAWVPAAALLLVAFVRYRSPA